MKKTTLIFMIAAFACTLVAQTNRDYILQGIDKAAMQRKTAQLRVKYELAREIALRKALENGWDTLNLRWLDEYGNPIYDKLDNNEAAIISNTDDARTKLNTTGAGMEIGMWEAEDPATSSAPLEQHQDFSDGNGGDRIVLLDWGPSTPASDHATHVAGTLIGKPPVNNASRGMATDAVIRARSSAGDVTEMRSEALAGMLVSNHSYGWTAGWSFDDTQNSGFPLYDNFNRWTWFGGSAQFNAGGDDPNFGSYPSQARNYDDACYDYPYYLPVWSSGNNHTDNPQEAPNPLQVDDQVRNGQNGSYVEYDPAIHPKGDGEQTCNVAGGALSINGLTVGNMTKTGGINNSSSRGVGDDGRMFPHICGTGTDIYSAWNNATNGYNTISGTSMAAPNVAGSLILLQDGYEKLHGGQGEYMRSATLKALAIHTALDILGNYGPDYTFGWGRLDAGKAADVINEDGWKTPTSRHTIIEDVYAVPGSSSSYLFKFSGTEELKVTLAYTDPVNFLSSSPLQNDLDLTVVRLSPYLELQPFVLDPNNPTAQATFGDNDIENVEQVRLSAANTQAGIYRVEVKLEGSSLYNGDPQPFSLIVSGLNANCHYVIRQDRHLKLASGQYKASTYVESAAEVESGKDVTFQAGAHILRPGFHAKQGSKFKTVLSSCN